MFPHLILFNLCNVSVYMIVRFSRLDPVSDVSLQIIQIIPLPLSPRNVSLMRLTRGPTQNSHDVCFSVIYTTLKPL